ncbi:MAG TPA: hexameric tyrosine-coordinated heme protein [Taishania sp.]|nr:hexameric tyrosine-coordinated heme protein [Taishania sp.]HNS43023.1 hexameric tyrosine-coordinated heme protein [Taishania sp.]
MENTEIWLDSLITKTPQEGRELAIKMARKTIGAIQSDPEVKKRLRPQYAEDAGLLVASAEVVALEFQTVAAANNYWR